MLLPLQLQRQRISSYVCIGMIICRMCLSSFRALQLFEGIFKRGLSLFVSSLSLLLLIPSLRPNTSFPWSVER